MDEGLQVVINPIIIVMEDETQTGVITHLHPPEDWTHQAYGLVICDLVRHVANCFNVPEDDVWEYVDKERYHPTTKLHQMS